MRSGSSVASGVDAPVVHGDRDVVEQRVVAGEVEVDHAALALVVPEHVVVEEVAVDDRRCGSTVSSCSAW